MKTQLFGRRPGSYDYRFYWSHASSVRDPRIPCAVAAGALVRQPGTKYGLAFVPGAFSENALDELRKNDWYKARFDEARDAYLANRKNGVDRDSPVRLFPGDGAYSWDTPEDEVQSAIRYTEGPQDKAWMEARDRNYVFRLEQEGRLDKEEPNLRTEVPSLYAEVMAKRQSRLAEEKMAQETQARLAEQTRAAQAAAVKREQEVRARAEAEERARVDAMAREAAAKKPPALPARLVPPLVSQVTKLLQKARQQRLSSEEQEELTDIESYHQHFYNAPLTEEARHELMRNETRLKELINHKTATPPADAAAPAVAVSPANRRPALAEAKPESERSVSSSERVRRWREANAAAVDPNERPFADEQDVSDRESDDDASIVTAQFRSSDPYQIAQELVKRIRREGAFSFTIEEDDYIEIRCRPDKVETIVAQAMKVTLSKLFNNIKYPDNQTIRLPWEHLSDKQVRKFEVLFAREKQDIRLATIQDAGEDIKSSINGVARRVAPTP